MWRLARKLVLLLVLGLLSPACGGDDEPTARIVFDGLADGSSLAPTNASTLTVSGTALLIHGGFPTGSVNWQNGDSSGTAPLEVDCLVVCWGYWSATVPLSLGVNVVTVSYLDATVRLSVSRYPVMVVSGTVAMATTGAGVSDVLVQLDGFPVALRTGVGGDFAFMGVTPGTHRIAPSLPAPQSGCLSFLPESITIEATATDIAGQDFTATQVSPCYGISGRITSSKDPSFGVPYIEVALADARGATLSRVTDESGAYAFLHLVPGTYTVTPSDCGLGTCAQFSPPSPMTVIIDNGSVTVNFSLLF